MFDEISPIGTSSFSADNNEPRTVFPPLMSALDTYLDSDSNERMHEIITDVKQEKQRKKSKKLKKSPKKPTSKQSHSERPTTKLLPERIGDGNGSPTKTKLKILSNNIETDEEPQFEERIRTADNLHSQTHPPANGESNFKIPPSSPGIPSQPRTASSPRSAPRGGRYYKQLDSTAPVGVHSVSIDSSLPPSSFAHQNMSFNKAVESIAALKLHNFAMKRKQQITQRLKLLREIKSLEKENEEEYYLQQKKKQDLTLAAWKLRYYIEYLRLVSLQHVVEAIEEKNAFLEKDFQEHERRNESLKQEISDLKQALERKDQLVFESEEATKRLQSTIQVMDLDLQMTKEELQKQAQIFRDFEIEQEEERKRHAEELLSVEQTRKELEITRLTCQEMVRAAAQQKTEIEELRKTIDSHNSVVEEQAKEQQQVLDSQQVLVEELQRSHESDLEKIKDLENQLESQIDQKNEAILALEGQIYDLQTQKDELQQEKQNIETEFAQSDAKIKKIEDEKNSLQKVLTNMAIQLQESEALVTEQKLLSQQQLLIHQELQNQLRSQEEVIREFQQQEISYQEQIASFQALVKELLPTIENSMMRAEDYFEHMRQSSLLAERKTEYARYLEEELFHARRYYPYTTTAASNTAGTEIEYEEDAFEQEHGDAKNEFYEQNVGKVLPMNDSSVETEQIPEEATNLLQSTLTMSQITANTFKPTIDPEEILQTQKLVANDVVNHVLSDASHHISDLSAKIARSVSPAQNVMEESNKEKMEANDNRGALRSHPSPTTRKQSSGGGSANGKRRANSVPLHSQQLSTPPQIQAVEEKLTTLMKTLDDKLSSIDQVASTLKVLVEKAESLDRAQTPQPVVPPSTAIPPPSVTTATSSLKVETIPEEQEDYAEKTNGIGSGDAKIDRVMSEITLNTFAEGTRSRELVLQNVEELPPNDEIPNNDSLSISSKVVRVEDQINLEKLYQEMTKAAEEMNQELYFQQESIIALQELRNKIKYESGFISHQLASNRANKSLSDEQRQSLEQMKGQYRQQMKQLKAQISLAKQSQQDLTVKLIELQAEMFHIHQDIYNNGQEFKTLYKEEIFAYYPDDLVHASPVKIPPSRAATKQQSRSPTAKEPPIDGSFIGEGAFDFPERLLGAGPAMPSEGFSGSYSTMLTDEIAAMSATYEKNHQTLLTLMELERFSPTGSFMTIDTEQTSKEDDHFLIVKPAEADLPLSNVSSPEISTPKRRKSEKLEKKASRRLSAEPLIVLREEDEEKRTDSAEKKTRPSEITQLSTSAALPQPEAAAVKLDDPSLTSAITKPDVIHSSSIASQPTVPIEAVPPSNVEHHQHLPTHLETAHLPIEHASPWSPPRSPAAFTNAKAPRGLKSASFQRKFEFQKRQQSLREQFVAMKIELERLASTLVNHLETMPILLETRQEVYQEIDGWREQFYELCGVYPDENDQQKSKVYQTLIEAYRETDSQLAVTSADYKSAYEQLQEKIGEIIPIQDELYHLMQNTTSSFSASASSAIPLEKEDFAQAYSSFLTLDQLIAQYTPRPIIAPANAESEDTSIVAGADEKFRPASALESSLMSIPETSLEPSSEAVDGVFEEKKVADDSSIAVTVIAPSLFEQMHNPHLNEETVTVKEAAIPTQSEKQHEETTDHQHQVEINEKKELNEEKGVREEESLNNSTAHVAAREDVMSPISLQVRENEKEEEVIEVPIIAEEKEIPSIINESSVYSMSFEDGNSTVLKNEAGKIPIEPSSMKECMKEGNEVMEQELVRQELAEKVKEEERKRILSEISTNQTNSFLKSSLNSVIDKSIKQKQEKEAKEKQQKEQTRRMSNVQATSFIASMMTSLPAAIKSTTAPVTQIKESDEKKENDDDTNHESDTRDKLLANNDEDLTKKDVKAEEEEEKKVEKSDEERSVSSHPSNIIDPPSTALDSHKQSHDHHHVAFDEKVVVLPQPESEDDIDESEIWRLTATTATTASFLISPTTTTVEVEPDSSETKQKEAVASEDAEKKETEEYSSAGVLTTYLSTTDDDYHLTTTTATTNTTINQAVSSKEKGDDENYEDDNDFASIEQESLHEEKRKKATADSQTTPHNNTDSPAISSSAFAFTPISSNQPSVELDNSSILSASPNHHLNLNTADPPLEQAQPSPAASTSRKEATMAQLNAMVAEYQALKAELKTWRDGFYVKHKREPNITDFNHLNYDLKVKIARKNQLKKILNNYKHLNLNLTGEENSEKIIHK